MSSIDSSVRGVLASQQSAMASKISTTVMAKSLDAAKQQGDAMVGLIEAAAELGKSLNSGKTFDATG
jgi:hypothetical protein